MFTKFLCSRLLNLVQHSFNSAPGVAQQQRSQAYINFWMDQNGDPGDGRNQDALATARHSIVVSEVYGKGTFLKNGPAINRGTLFRGFFLTVFQRKLMASGHEMEK